MSKFNPKVSKKDKIMPKTISYRPSSPELYHKIWDSCNKRNMVMNDFIDQALVYALDNLDEKP